MVNLLLVILKIAYDLAQSEVSNFDHALGGNEAVSSSQVTVDAFLLVKIAHATSNLNGI
jgi:hypothetical protein